MPICRTPSPFLRPWRCYLFSAQGRGSGLLQSECSDRQLEVFGRIGVLAKVTSHCPVSCLRSMACFRGAPVAPRLGASAAALLGHSRDLNQARKNAAGNRRRNEVRWRFGHGAFERGYRNLIRFAVESPRVTRLRVTGTTRNGVPLAEAQKRLATTPAASSQPRPATLGRSFPTLGFLLTFPAIAYD